MTHQEIGRHFQISKQRVQKLLATYTGITAKEGGRSIMSSSWQGNAYKQNWPTNGIDNTKVHSKFDFRDFRS